jgi:hypothetical protein
MLKTITSNRTYALTAIIFGLAFVICGAAWMRFFAAAAANPSPVRYVTLMGTNGPLNPFRQDCAGPSFVEGDAVWRFCEYDDGDTLSDPATVWGLVRFDLAQGEATMRWPLPYDQTSQVLALAQAENGDLAVAWGTPSLTGIYRIVPAGGVEAFGFPPGGPDDVAGMAWVGDGVEVVTEQDAAINVNRVVSGIWADPRPVTPPDRCTDGTLCDFQFAHVGADGWLFLYAVAPTEAADPVLVEFVLAPETGGGQVIDSILLADLAPAQYTLDEQGNLAALGDLFDQAPGNVVNWSLDAAPFMLHGGTWEKVVAPENDASFYFSDYRIAPDGLQWIPGLRYPRRGWQMDQWLTLKSSGEGVALATFYGKPGPTLTGNQTFLQEGGTQTSLLPSTDGGYWLLGPYGSYLKANESLTRADRLSLSERIERAFDNFGELEAVNDDFYREQETLKMAAFPLVLLSLPAGYVLVFFVRQFRKDTRAWVLALAQVSGIYLILATLFLWWFWEITAAF